MRPVKFKSISHLLILDVSYEAWPRQAVQNVRGSLYAGVMQGPKTRNELTNTLM
jgi:hypothetical protein